MRKLNNHLRSVARERGQVLVIVAGVLPILLGMTGLAIDVGSYMGDRRHLQNSADSMALAGAQLLPDEDAAQDVAEEWADKNDVDLDDVDIEIDTSGSVPEITVHVQRPHSFHFMKVLGIQEKDTLLVLNQTDRLTDRGQLGPVLHRYPNAVPISAKTGDGLDRLHDAVSRALSRSFADLDVETSAGNGRLLAYLAAHGEVLSRRYDDDRVIVHVRIPQRHMGPLHQEGTSFGPHVYAFDDAAEVAEAARAAQDVA